MKTKRFVGPGGKFSLYYPEWWCEEPSDEETLGFFDPNEWTGTFRISIHIYKSAAICQRYYKHDLALPGAKRVTLGKWVCAYNHEVLDADGVKYDAHYWTMTLGTMFIECSFSPPVGYPTDIAKAIIKSLEVRDSNEPFPTEFIPLRSMEEYTIDDSYDKTIQLLKKLIKKGFQSSEKDIPSLQRLIDGDWIPSKDFDAWLLHIAIAFGCIVVNEIDGMEWISVVSTEREYPALRYKDSNLIIDVQWLVASKNAQENHISLSDIFEEIKNLVINA